MREADGFQKTGKGPHIPHQRFCLHFLAQVERRISTQGRRRILRTPDQRHETNLQRPPQAECVPQFRRHERMHGGFHQPSGEQIRAAPPQFARTGTGKNEPQIALRFRDLMHHVQQGRYFLDFVYDDFPNLGVPGNEFAQSFRTRLIEALRLRIRQIEP